MIYLCKERCSRQTVQHKKKKKRKKKKKISDQACALREDREQKYQKKSVAGGLNSKLLLS